jgi:hypothetical protein
LTKSAGYVSESTEVIQDKPLQTLTLACVHSQREIFCTKIITAFLIKSSIVCVELVLLLEKEVYESTAQVEQFVKLLRLDAKSARVGADSVRNLIREISFSWRGSYGPDWLYTERAAKTPRVSSWGLLMDQGVLGAGALGVNNL